MHHGLLLANAGTYSDPRTVVEVAQAAEGAGWDGLFLWDHLAFVWGPPAADPWVTLAAVAAATERLRIGTAVTPVARRRPHVLAHQVATLDVLSGGRVVFGAGLGGVEREFGAFGEPTEARARAALLDEGLDVLRHLWAGERVDHHGGHFEVDGVTLAPGPVQEPLPIWIGGNAPPALRRAARFDGWIADTADRERMTMTPDDLVERLGRIRDHRGDLDGFDVAVHGFCDRGPGPDVYARTGATWWLEDVHDLRADLEETLALVRAGPQ